MEYRGLSISNKLLFSFLAVVILLSGILVRNFIIFSEKNAENHAKDQLLQSFDYLYQDVNENLIRVSQNLEVLSGNPVIDDYLMTSGIERELIKQSVDALFKKYADQYPQYRTIKFVDYSGSEIAQISNGISAFELNDLKDNGFLKKISSAKPNNFSTPVLQKCDDGTYSLLVAKSKNDPDIGEFAGAIIIELSLKSIFEAYDKVRFFGEKIFWILSDSGEIIKKPLQNKYALDPQPYLPQSLLSSANVLLGDYGLIIARDIEYPKGQPMIRMAVSVPHNLLRRGFGQYLDSLLLIVLTSILVVFILALFLSRFLSRPIIRLAKASAQISETGLFNRVDVNTSGELDVLVYNFNMMLENLEKTTVSKDFVETVLNSIQDEIAIINVDDFTIASANQSFLYNHLKDPDETISLRTCHELIRNNEKPCSKMGLFCPVEETKTTGKKSTFEICRDRGVYERYFGITAFPIKNEKGRVVQVVYVSEDITERKKTELQIKKQQEKLAIQNTELTKLLEDVELAKQEIESNRRKLHEALKKLSSIIQKVAREEDFSIRIGLSGLIPCYEFKLCTMEDCPCYGKEATRCWQTTGTYCLNNDSETLAKKITNCEECDFYLEMTKDEITRIGEQFNNMMYILELKNKELQNAYKMLKESQGQILQQEKMASIGQLAAGVAHEINNPLGFISSNLGTLDKYTNRLFEFLDIQNDVLVSLSAVTETKDSRKKLKIDYIQEDLKDLIQESLEGADRVKEIVQNLKTFSRVDQQEEALSDINENIESTLKIIWNELKYKTTVHKEYGELPKTLCFPQQLNQVFMNILINAAHAIETQGDIHIKTWHADNSVYVSISDTGKGIKEENLTKIFEPFFTTKEVGKGTGLGMSIVYEIIKKHNGDIKVESTVGKGTTFTIQLPIVIERSEAA